MGANPTQIFQRNSKWSRGVFRSLATTVIVKGYVCTNLHRAKVLRRIVDRLITLAKKGTLASRRSAAGILRKIETQDGIEALSFLFNQLKERYSTRAGGYTRIIKIAPRRGDNTKMAILELV